MDIVYSLRSFADSDNLRAFVQYATEFFVLAEVPGGDRDHRPPEAIRVAVREKLIQIYSVVDPEFDKDLVYIALSIFDLYAVNPQFSLDAIEANIENVSYSCLLLALKQKKEYLLVLLMMNGVFSSNMLDLSVDIELKTGRRRFICPSDFISLWELLMPLRSSYQVYARDSTDLIAPKMLDNEFLNFRPSVVALAGLLLTSNMIEYHWLKLNLDFMISKVSHLELSKYYKWLKGAPPDSNDDPLTRVRFVIPAAPPFPRFGHA